MAQLTDIVEYVLQNGSGGGFVVDEVQKRPSQAFYWIAFHLKMEYFETLNGG